MKALKPIAAALFMLAACGGGKDPPPEPSPSPDPLAEAAFRIAAIMDDAELCGQVLMVAASASYPMPASEAAFLASLKPGGIIVFGPNVDQDPARAAAYFRGIQDAAAWAPRAEPASHAEGKGRPISPGAIRPFVATDHEGGSVQRLRSGFSRLPSAEAAGRLFSTDGLEALGEAVGAQLAAVGIGMTLGPLVEPGRGEADFSRGRYYSDDAERAAVLSGAFLRGLQAAGIPCAAKHYPGMTDQDPHQGLPSIDLSLEALMAGPLLPFSSLARGDARDAPAAIMLSHVIMTEVDPDEPASLSPRAIALLRENIGYTGLLITDDIHMKAVSERHGYEEAALRALGAGADMVMLSENRAAIRVRDALLSALEAGRISRGRLEGAVARALEIKLRYGLTGPAIDRVDALAPAKEAADAILKAAGFSQPSR
jgi:beta-N-acetylhexosaminidase